MSLKFSIAWVVAGLALHFTFAFLMGMRHERGQAAQRDNATLTRELSNARAAARELHEWALSIQSEQVAGIERLNAIARDFEESREQYQTHFTRQRVALSTLLATRPDLDTSAGADVLRHWTASNAGTGAEFADTDTAPAANPGGPDAAVPGITDAGGRELGEFACEPRCSHSPLPPVPDDAAAFDRGDENVGTHSEANLLRADKAHRAHSGDMP